MLQIGNPQHIFSDIKEAGKLWTGTGQKAAGAVDRTGRSVLKDIKEN